MKLDVLVAALNDLGWRYEILINESAGRVVALERGGRVLGVYPHEASENMLWMDPQLADYAYVQRKFVQGKEWNVGGERTWISPEVEYYIRDLKAIYESYTVQASIDPGSYVLEQPIVGSDKNGVKSVCWQQQVTAQAFRSEVEQAFQLTKTCRLIPDPMRMMGADIAPLSYRYVGYEMTMRLGWNGVSCGQAPLSLWTIMQVPAGGEAIIPTYGHAAATDFFAPTSPSHLTVAEDAVRFKIDAKAQHKISVKSIYLTGRLGYFREGADGNAYLIVRNIPVNPSGEYADVPVDRLSDQGHCVQCYNDDGQLGAFGELEYHTPAIDQGAPNSPTFLQDASQVWYYSGETKTIEAIAKRLLGSY